VNHRWLGGTLTNWATLVKSIKRLKPLKAMTEDGRINELSKKGRRRARELKHLNQNPEGIENMSQLPDAMFVIVECGRDCGEGSAADGRAGGFRGRYELRSRCGGLDYPGGMSRALRAIRLFTTKIGGFGAGRTHGIPAIAGGGTEVRGRSGAGGWRRVRGYQRV
jgi:small subunit ribosomal protein S2